MSIIPTSAFNMTTCAKSYPVGTVEPSGLSQGHIDIIPLCIQCGCDQEDSIIVNEPSITRGLYMPSQRKVMYVLLYNKNADDKKKYSL